MKANRAISNRLILMHIICWLAFIGYEIFFIVVVFQSKALWGNYIFFYACNIGLFYWHYNTLSLYMGSGRSRYMPMILFTLIEFSVILGIKWAYDYFSLKSIVPENQFWQEFKTYAGIDFQRTILYIFYSSIIWSAFNFGKFRRDAAEALLKSTVAEKANTELKVQFAEAQNAFLKQQINPHLLFNALNAIYSSVYIHSPEDSRLVLLLSDIMNFSYEDADPHGRVPLKNELNQLNNLIELNTFRFQSTVHLELKIVGDPGHLSIIPLALMTLTENMFKHGDLRLKPRSLDIIIFPDGRLRYLSKNVPKPRDNYQRKTKVGLSNTKLRLDFAYPNNYDLTINESEDLFSVELNINLAYERNDH